MALCIRPASKGDEPAALALAGRLEEGVSPWRDRCSVAQAVRAWVAASVDAGGQEDRASFVAEQHGQIVGFVSVAETRHWSGDKEAYIGELMVAEAAEGQGIGRALVTEASAWGRSRGCLRISLETGAANDLALVFYNALGFEHDEVRLSRGL